MIWHAGLRGAVAFGIATTLTIKHARIVQSTISVLIVVSVILLGGTTHDLLKRLNIPPGSPTEPLPRAWMKKLAEFDEQYHNYFYNTFLTDTSSRSIKPIFTCKTEPQGEKELSEHI